MDTPDPIKELDSYIDQMGVNRDFVSACSQGDFNSVKELFDPNLSKLKPDIHAEGDACLIYASASGNVELVKFLIENNANIHIHENASFKVACDFDKIEVLSYFIFQCNLEKTQEIEVFLKEKNKPYIDNMFKLRELNQHLNESLNVKNKPESKPKI